MDEQEVKYSHVLDSRSMFRSKTVLTAFLALSVSAATFAKQKHTEADYKSGWLEFWSVKVWGPDVYYDSQNGLTCFAAHGHELAQCYKDSNSDEWVVKIADDDYMQVAAGDISPRQMLSDTNKTNALLDMTTSCLASASSESSKRIALEEAKLENSVPQGQVTTVNCAVQVRYRIEGANLYVPLYRKGKLVDEVGYDSVFLEHTPGGRGVSGPRNNFFLDVWDYSK